MKVPLLKNLGQHFLLQPRLNAIIADTLLEPCDEKKACVIEIGAGSGALTCALLQHPKTGSAIAIELDARLKEHLQTLASPARLTVINADAMRLDFHGLTTQRPIFLCGNLPYQIATPLIMGALAHRAHYRRMVFVVQKEIALRFTAHARSRHYGRVSVLAQRVCAITIVRSIPRAAFTPPPKVSSSLLVLEPHAKPLAEAPHAALDFVLRLCFSQRRKMIKNTLKNVVQQDDQLELLLADTKIDGRMRPEELDVSGFCRLARHPSVLQGMQGASPTARA